MVKNVNFDQNLQAPLTFFKIVKTNFLQARSGQNCKFLPKSASALKMFKSCEILFPTGVKWSKNDQFDQNLQAPLNLFKIVKFYFLQARSGQKCPI